MGKNSIEVIVRALCCLGVFASWWGQVEKKFPAIQRYDEMIDAVFMKIGAMELRRGKEEHLAAVKEFDRMATTSLKRALSAYAGRVRPEFVMAEAASCILTVLKAKGGKEWPILCELDRLQRALFEDGLTEDEAIAGTGVYLAVADHLDDAGIKKLIKKSKVKLCSRKQ